MPGNVTAGKEPLTLYVDPALAYALRLRKARRQGAVTAIVEKALLDYFAEDVAQARKELAAAAR